MIGGNAARAMEAELFCIGALWSPETGIIDSHGYMLALWGELEDRGGMIAFETPVERMSYKAPQWHVQFGGRDAGVMQFDAVVNAAGLGAQPLARRIEGYPADKVPRLVLGKGNYFGFAGVRYFPGSSIRPRSTAGWACTSRSILPAGCASVPTSNGSPRRTTPSIRAARTAFYDRIRTYWPGLPGVRWCPIIAASGRS